MRLLTILAVTLLHPGVGHPAGSYAVTQTTSRTMLSSTQDVCQGAEIKPYISPPRLITQYIRTPSGSETARLRLAIQAKSGRPQSAPSSQALQSARSSLQTLFERVYSGPVLSSQHMLEAGLINVGDTRRIERAMQKLIHGQSVSLVALGDSISSDDGTSQPEYTWIHWVFEWIQLVFPHPEHKLHFVPAINGTSLSPCVLKGLPPMMDIILMESSQCGPTSSGAPDEAARQGMEYLLRSLLAAASRPALIQCSTLCHESDTNTAENSLELLAKHYSLQSLSMQAALHPKLAEDPGLQILLWQPKDDSNPPHLSCIGHRYKADQVISFLQDIVAAVILKLDQATSHLEDLGEAKLPMFAGQWDLPAQCRL